MALANGHAEYRHTFPVDHTLIPGAGGDPGVPDPDRVRRHARTGRRRGDVDGGHRAVEASAAPTATGATSRPPAKTAAERRERTRKVSPLGEQWGTGETAPGARPVGGEFTSGH